MLKLRGGCLIPARRYSSCGGAAGGGFPSEFLLRHCRRTELPSSVRSSSILGGDLEKTAIFTPIRRCFHGIEPPQERTQWTVCFSRESPLLGGRGFQKPGLFDSLRRRCFSSAAQVAVVDEETDLTARLSSPSSLSPWLMVPPGLVSNSSGEEAFNDHYFHYFYLYNVSENKMLKIKMNNKIRLPWQRDILSANEAICLGSSQGWLAFLHPHNCSLFLFNPLLLSSSEFPYLPLPPVETLTSVISSVRRRKEDRDSIVIKYSVPWDNPVSAQELSSRSFVIKLILSSAPFPFLSNYDHRHQEDITVMAILGYHHQKLAFCRVGDRAWTTLDTPLPSYEQLVYISKDQLFYTLSTVAGLEAWDLRDPDAPKSILITNFEPPLIQPTMDEQQQRFRRKSYVWSSRTRYLVESCSGDLLMVIRYSSPHFDEQGHKIYDSHAYKTVAFDVYKLDFDSISHKKKKKWVYMTSLGDEALFVGQNDCFSLPASNFPGLSKNSIYFTPNCYLGMADYGGQDMGIFSLEDGSITPFFHCDSKKNLPPPVWIIPQPLPQL